MAVEWIERWETGNTPWHRDKVADSLVKYIDQLTDGNKQARMLIPLCSKSLEMKWLVDQGYDVVGVELAELAAKQFLKEHNITFTTHRRNDDVIIYEAVDVKLRIVISDILSCTSEMCGGAVDAIWDMNALVAIPMDNWSKYIDVCVSLLKPRKRILLSTSVYNESERGTKPVRPYNVPSEKVQRLYGDKFDVHHLEDVDFLYFAHDKFLDEGWTPTKFHQSINLLVAKN